MMADGGRVILVTGASSGIGEAVARGAAAGGHRVVLAARSADRIAAIAGELGGPERALAVACDVTEWDQVAALADAAVRAFGGIDVVVANAGFGAKRGFLAESPEFWRAMVLTNVYGAAITVRATFEQLRARRGHLFLMGSVAGRKVPPGSVYGATKWAVTAMAEAARQELHGSGVRVTLVSPGTVETPFYDEPVGGEQLTADDVARAVLFAMDQPSHVDVNEILIRPTVQEF
jgi:NADP-dependent 3-hydroxy acid dehydrogenase YdfG